MSDDIAISVQGVSKAFRIWNSPTSRLLSPAWVAASNLLPENSSVAKKLLNKATSHYRDFWALQECSLEVKKGESVGIIGRNGSGKSTLLQIIAGTLQPTAGSVKVNGRVAALLELGSGFNPEFTGRENVFLNGAILGLSEDAINARYDQIAAFAEIGDFLEQPVKTYSSGMTVRLAFAVAAHVDADILIIDEALSVGDARFQLKCARTIDRFVEKGGTLLFVSHDASSVNRLCSAAILLEKGHIQLLNSPRIVTNFYAKMMTDDRGLDAIKDDLIKLNETPFLRTQKQLDSIKTEALTQPVVGKINATALQLKKFGDLEMLHADTPTEEMSRTRQLSQSEQLDFNIKSEREFEMGDGGVKIETITSTNQQGSMLGTFHSGEIFCVRAVILAKTAIDNPIFAIRIRDAKSVDIYGTNTFYRKIETPKLLPGQRLEIVFNLEANLMGGAYFISIGCSHFDGSQLVVHHRRYDAIEITVVQHDHSFGIAQCNAKVTFSQI
jgi:lipopolysaccharide transport system ATP-binding protein